MNGPQRLALARLHRRGCGAVEAEDPANAAAAEWCGVLAGDGLRLVGRDSSGAPRSLQPLQQPGRVGGRALHRQAVALAAAALGRLDDAVLEAAAPDDEPQGAAEQLGVGELLPRPRVALVIEGLDAGGAQVLIEAVGDLAL